MDGAVNMNAIPSSLWAKKWQPRCEDCNRRIFGTDFVRGLAHSEEHWFDTLGGPDSREIYYHTYDCEHLPRRRVK